MTTRLLSLPLLAGATAVMLHSPMPMSGWEQIAFWGLGLTGIAPWMRDVA